MQKLYIAFIICLFPFLGSAQVVIRWDFATAAPSSSLPSGIAAVSNVVQGNNNASATGAPLLITSVSASSGYTDDLGAAASGGNNAGIAARAMVGLNPSTSAYFEFTLTPAAGMAVSVSQINFGTRSTGTGPQTYDLRSSVDGFAATLGTGSIVVTGTPWAYKTNVLTPGLAGGTDAPVTIRIYGYNGTGSPASGTANWRMDDLGVTVGGSATPTASVSVAPATLDPFSTVAGTESAAQTLTVSGSTLTDDITVAVPTGSGYELSIDNITWTNSLTLAQTGGTVGNTTLSVRINKDASAGALNTTLSVSSPGATTRTVALTGTVNSGAAPGNPPPAHVVINQVYGGGGNSGSVLKNDFIELFNNEDTAVNLQGWSVQYTSAAGTTWQMTTLSGMIPAHGFWLIREAAGSSTTATFPAADDITGTIAMGAGSGKVILCNCIIAQSGANPPGADLNDTTVRDKVGYGAGTNGSETSPAAGPASGDNTSSVQRITDGVDHDNNSTDLQLATALPRNSTYTTSKPVVTGFNPPNGVQNIPSATALSLVFDKPVQAGSGNITIIEDGTPRAPIAAGSGDITITGGTVGIHAVLSPGRSYAIRIDGAAFHDVYGNFFAGVSDNTTWAFTTFNSAAVTPLPATINFDACTGSGLLPDGFTQFSVTGAQIWDCTAFGRDPAAPAGTTPAPNGIQVNGFANNINNTNEDWLISPKFDLTGTTFPLLNFWSRNNFSGDQLQLKVSTDYSGSGDPTLATWTDVNGKFPSEGTNIWTLSADVNLSSFKQSSVYFAFVYKSTTEDGARWTLDDISLRNSLTPPDPSLTVDIQNMEFGFTANGGNTVKTLTVTGNDLTSDITLTTLGNNFLVSTNGTDFSGSATILQAANNVPQTVYVRFTPSQANTQFNDHLFITIPNAADTLLLKGNSVDPASTLSIVNWNMEWFGTPATGNFGPPNKALQEQNAGIVLPALNADLYVLQEVVNDTALKNIVATMPGYAYVINNYGSHSNTKEAHPFPLTEVQKLAFVYNTTKITNIHTDSLLTTGVNTAADTATQYYSNWAGGRYPYMLTADVVLGNNSGGTITRQMRFINIHAKANSGSSNAALKVAYDNRKAAAFALDSLIQANYATDNVIILGDFNDDLDHTITAGITPPTTSYSPFTVDHADRYKFLTLPLSLAGGHSDVNFTGSVIDNVVTTNAVSNLYFPGSVTIRTDVSGLVSKYGTTTSDHYPIFSQFTFSGTPLPVKLLEFTATRQDGQAKLAWSTAEETNSAKFEVERSGDGQAFETIGTLGAQGNSSTRTDYTFYDRQPLYGNNYYRLHQIDLDGKAEYSKVVKLNFVQQLTVHINPNPAHGVVNITVENASDQLSLQILDLSGRLVRQQLLTAGTQNTPVAIDGLTKGIYTVKVVSKAGVTTQKLLVQ